MARKTRQERYARDHDKELAYAKKYREANREKLKAYNREYRLSHREYFKSKNAEWRFENRERHLAYMKKYHADKYHKRYHGIDRKTYEAMCAKQQFLCLVCQRKQRLIVDHCHKTGALRGLLCRSCNTALGLLADNRTLFHRAVLYLDCQLA